MNSVQKAGVAQLRVVDNVYLTCHYMLEGGLAIGCIESLVCSCSWSWPLVEGWLELRDG